MLQTHIFLTTFFVVMDSLLTALDVDAKICPNLKLCQDVYKYEISIKNSDDVKSESLKSIVMEQVIGDDMAPFYELLCAKFDWEVDEDKLKVMR